MTSIMTICMLIMMAPTKTSGGVDRFRHIIIVVLSCLLVTFLLWEHCSIQRRKMEMAGIRDDKCDDDDNDDDDDGDGGDKGW